MQNTVKDNFKYDTQGENYDVYRPRYPTSFRDQTLAQLKQDKTNYMDLAAGTGQLFFQYQEYFSGVKVANDNSQKQLDVLSSKLDSNVHKNCHTVVCDANQLKPTLLQSIGDVRFDLITMGQAIHWFNVPNLLKDIKENYLRDEHSIFCVPGYCRGDLRVDYNKLATQENIQIQSEEEKLQLIESLDKAEKAFYNKVKQYYECDRDALESGYRTYDKDFDAAFKNHIFSDFTTFVPMTLERSCSYKKTSSAYNQFKEKCPDAKDPIDEFRDQFKEEYELIKAKYGLKSDEPPIEMKIYYFQHLMWN